MTQRNVGRDAVASHMKGEPVDGVEVNSQTKDFTTRRWVRHLRRRTASVVQVRTADVLLSAGRLLAVTRTHIDLCPNFEPASA